MLSVRKMEKVLNYKEKLILSKRIKRTIRAFTEIFITFNL